MRTSGRLFAFAFVAAAMVVPATSDAAPKPKKPPAEISIENGRQVALKSFEIVFIEVEAKPGKTVKPPRKPVLKLDAPLPPGEKTSVKLSGAKGCAYVARWSFEDAGDEGPIDICGDPKIVMTD